MKIVTHRVEAFTDDDELVQVLYQGTLVECFKWMDNNCKFKDEQWQTEDEKYKVGIKKLIK